MHRSCFVVVLVVACLNPFGVLLAGELPDRLSALGGAEPFWVSANSVTVNGSFNSAALPSMARIAVESRETERRSRDATALASSGSLSDCVGVVANARHISDRPASTWAALNGNAEAIYHGLITAVTPGFFNGTPTALLSVKIASALRTHKGYPSAGDVVYIDFPATDFTIGARRFCAQSVRGDGFVPEVGDDVLIFAYLPPADTTRRYLPTSDEYVVFGHGSRTSIPAILRTDATLPPMEMRELLRDVRRRGEEGRQR